MATVGKRDIEIIKGDDYSNVVTMSTRVNGVVTPTDITGRTYTAQMKETASQVLPTATFTCVVTDATHGEITITLSHTITSTLIPGCYVWDLKQNASGILTTIIGGEAKVKLAVTG